MWTVLGQILVFFTLWSQQQTSSGFSLRATTPQLVPSHAGRDGPLLLRRRDPWGEHRRLKRCNDIETQQRRFRFRPAPVSMGIFDRLQDAFSNDPTISPDKSEGQLEDPDSPYSAGGATQQTDVQKRWLQSQQSGGDSSPRRVVVRGNARIEPESLVGTRWTLDLFLAGIPDRDPSNDLFGSKTNISSRDKDLGVGVTCPEEPSLSVEIELAKDGVCRAKATDFTTGAEGQWKVQEDGDGNMIRISLDTIGYRRTVQTTGTITKVFWSAEDEVSAKTSSTYSIPAGFVYADSVVGYGLPGEFVMDDGLLRVEKKMGVLGAASKMLPCGKFRGEMLKD